MSVGSDLAERYVRFSCLLAAAFFCFISVAGCQNSDELRRVSVEGQVTVDGEPLQTGSVTLTPTGDTKGPMVTLEIVDARFSVAVEDGPTPGQYTATHFAGVASGPGTREQRESFNGRPTPETAIEKTSLDQLQLIEKTTIVSVPDQDSVTLTITF